MQMESGTARKSAAERIVLTSRTPERDFTYLKNPSKVQNWNFFPRAEFNFQNGRPKIRKLEAKLRTLTTYPPRLWDTYIECTAQIRTEQPAEI